MEQYDLADQGGELCSLRYDLTVPFGTPLNRPLSYGRDTEQPLSPVLGDEQGRYPDQALPHCESLPQRSAGSEEGPHEGIR